MREIVLVDPPHERSAAGLRAAGVKLRRLIAERRGLRVEPAENLH